MLIYTLFFCGISGVGCPKKLLEIVDTELCDWETKLDDNVIPKHFLELDNIYLCTAVTL